KEETIKDGFGMELFITHVPDSDLLKSLSRDYQVPLMGLHYPYAIGDNDTLGKLISIIEPMGRRFDYSNPMVTGADDRIVKLADKFDIDITIHPNVYQKLPRGFRDYMNSRTLLENLPAKGKDVSKLKSKKDLEAWTDEFIEMANKNNVRGITLDVAHLAAIFTVMKMNRQEELESDEVRQFILAEIKKMEELSEKPIENIHASETRIIDYKGSPLSKLRLKPKKRLEDGVSLTRQSPGSPRLIEMEKLMQEWIAGENFPRTGRITQEVWPLIHPNKTITDVVSGAVFMWQCTDLWQMAQDRAKQE
ncbi:hypothetical protein ACFL2B_03370, partial [Patescibacteria group bacterium]